LIWFVLLLFHGYTKRRHGSKNDVTVVRHDVIDVTSTPYVTDYIVSESKIMSSIDNVNQNNINMVGW
jgi:hypothetical protein